MSRATIKDIAAKLSVSASTVSRALRNHPDISAETTRKVQNMAKKLDYFPDSLAQGLKGRRTNTIGIIVPEIKHDFFSSVISGVEDVTYTAGFTIMVCQSNEDVEREKINIRSLVSNRIAGLLISISQSTVDVSHFNILKKREIPVVFFDRTNKKITDSQVIVDDYKAAYEATTHLIQRGYQRIAHLAGPSNISIGLERCSGYKQALLDNGRTIVSDLIIHGGFRQEDGNSGITNFLKMKNPPDAIFAVNDPVAIGAFRKIKEVGIHVPKDIALVGFSNNPISSLIDPPLTTVEQPSYEMGKIAAKLLLEQIDSDSKTTPGIKKILSTKLLVRKSS